MLMLGRKPVSPLCMPYAGFEKANNCILEIPQNIKCEINGSILTLKSKSTLVLGNGSTYTTLTTTSDLTRNIPSVSRKQRHIVWYKNGVLDSLDITYATSGSSAPTSFLAGVYALWLNPDDETIKFTNNAGSTWNTNNSYPIGIIDIDVDGVASFAKDSNGNDMIFNGACFVGHHAVIYPGVSGILAYGFNSDGSLKNETSTMTSLSIVEMTTGTYRAVCMAPSGNVYNNRFINVKKYSDLEQTQYLYQYCEEYNTTYVWDGSSFIVNRRSPIVKYDYNGTTVTNFTIQQPLTKYRWVVKLIP